MLRRALTLFLILSVCSIVCFAQDKGGDLTMAVIGFEQSGASGAKSDQKFFFDFFTSRPLPFLFGDDKTDVKPTEPFPVDKSGLVRAQPFGPPVHWWGDVRIASYPQQ